MSTEQDNLAEYRSLLDQIMRWLLRALHDAATTLPATPAPDASTAEIQTWQALKAAYQAQVLRALRRARRQAWAAAAIYLEAEAIRQGNVHAVIPPEPPLSDQRLQALLREAGPLTAEKNRKQLEKLIIRAAEGGARETIRDSVATADEPKMSLSESLAEQEQSAQRLHQAREELEDLKHNHQTEHKNPRYYGKPFAYARVVVSHPPCGFCLMLAARGPIYKSAKLAGKTRDSLNPNSYHTNCRCVVVPVYTYNKWPGKQASEEADALYKKLVTDEGLTGAQARTAIDNHLRGTRSKEKSRLRQEN